MFGKRYDGKVVKKMPPIQRIMPYIMKTRTDSMNMYEEFFPTEGMDAYIKKKSAEGLKLSYMHIVIAAMVRLLATRPQLNRFVMNGRIYSRPKIWVSFVVHHELRSDDDGGGTTIKLCFDGTENINDITEKINEAVKKETTKSTAGNSTDKLVDLIMSIPGRLIAFVVNVLMWMDKHSIMPKAIIEASPFHTSLFITNLKSLGINHIFHHTYEFGTTGLFVAIGKEKREPVVEKGEIVMKKTMGFGLVSDERFCDGLYFAKSLRIMRKLIRHPELLEERLEKKVEDNV